MEVFWAAFGGGAAGGMFSLLGVLLLDSFRQWRLRPMLRLRLEFGYLIPGLPGGGPRILTAPPSHAPSNGQAILIYCAYNPNPLPLEVTSYGLGSGKHGASLLVQNPDLFGDQPPKMLKQGESFTQTGLVGELAKVGLGWQKMNYVWFRTRSGHSFQARIPKREKERITEFLSSQHS
jgi:hypothetical protein